MLTDSQIWKALNRPGQLSLLAGPCVVETEKMCFEVARTLKKTCQKLGINYVFKASYDKANRSSGQSFRGPGMKAGLAVLTKIRKDLDLPIVTDIHSEQQVTMAAEVADVLQIPAFLC
ncbi:MAG: 3-deoxy-8-phosphooctulonate synthase, partial [Limisphaerales bacterium]